MLSFWLTTRRRRWYVIGAYVPTNDEPNIAQVEEALENTVKGVEVILIGHLNVSLREPCGVQEEELVMVVRACGMYDMTAHFMPRRRYRGYGRWT